jgi:hypothetical protein
MMNSPMNFVQVVLGKIRKSIVSIILRFFGTRLIHNQQHNGLFSREGVSQLKPAAGSRQKPGHINKPAAG